MSISDEQLIARYQLSRESADLDELFTRHLKSVRNLAYRLVLSNSVADDIAQDVFVKVIRNAELFRGEAKFSTWLYQITVNTTKEYFRKQSRSLRTVEDNVNNVHYSTNSPDKQVVQAEVLNEIEKALAKLSTNLRTAIVLTTIEQLSVREAADIEGCTTATMYWRVHQARKQLKQLLHQYLKP